MKQSSCGYTILIGATHGIGWAVADYLAQRGINLIIASRNSAELSESLSRLKQLDSAKHLSYALDVSSQNEVSEFAEWTVNQKLEINSLVNCAAILGPIGKTTAVNLDEFARCMQTNFFGSLYLCTNFIPIMSAKNRKKLILFSGGGGTAPFPNYSAYASSKAALVRLVENLAIEYAANDVDINCIAPGFVATRLHDATLKAGPSAAGAEYFERTKGELATGGVSAKLAAELVEFLISSASDGISGKIISAQWDQWRTQEFQVALREFPDFATIRRIDGKMYRKIQ